MSVEVVWEAGPAVLEDARVTALVEAALDHGGRAGIDIAVVFVDDDTLAGMHERWLGDSSPTDVISFDLGEEGGGPAGELYVSLERARRVAQQRAVPLERELSLYIVHGCLHLCGFDDREDADRERMRRAESLVLGEMGLPEDPRPFDAEGPEAGLWPRK